MGRERGPAVREGNHAGGRAEIGGDPRGRAGTAVDRHEVGEAPGMWKSNTKPDKSFDTRPRHPFPPKKIGPSPPCTMNAIEGLKRAFAAVTCDIETAEAESAGQV